VVSIIDLRVTAQQNLLSGATPLRKIHRIRLIASCDQPLAYLGLSHLADAAVTGFAAR
jgi:hypothetical protein